MALLSKSTVPSSHWYSADGTPVHRVPTKDGLGERPTTIRDAERLGLYPSVTNILGVLAKPGLEKWKLDQVALATLRMPKHPSESEDYYCMRIRNAAFEQVEAAADLGTDIHRALELAMDGQPYDEQFKVNIEPVLAWKAETGIKIVAREKRIVNLEHGFAGTTDVLFTWGSDNSGMGILDYKTRKTDPAKPITAYDNQALQLAAYGVTYWGEANVDRILAANVFISTTEPGRFAIAKHPRLARDWEAFKHIAAIWRYVKDYDPRQPK